MGGLFIEIEDLRGRVGTAVLPAVIDVRRLPVYESDGTILPTARWRDHAEVDDWAVELDPSAPVVLYCVHGHQVSQAPAAILRARGFDVRVLRGGIEGWRAAGAPLLAKPGWPGRDETRSSRWVTRAGPKVDRIACAWFIHRFVDRSAEILFVEADQVAATADEIAGMVLDIDGAGLGHHGLGGGFEAFLDRFEINDPALRRLAMLVRGADTKSVDRAPEAAGLRAMSLGISAIAESDQEAVARGNALYDALYAWCRLPAEATA